MCWRLFFPLFPVNYFMTAQISLTTPQRVPIPILGTTGTCKNDRRFQAILNSNTVDSHIKCFLIIPIWIFKRVSWTVPSVFGPCVAPWTVRDSLPRLDKVLAACLFIGTMPLWAGKEGTYHHPGRDRRTPHTGLPMGVQGPWLPALGVSEGTTRKMNRLDPQLPPLVFRIYYLL